MVDSHTELDCLRSLDSQAVSAVFDRYFPEVFRYARYRLGDEVLAEDVASEVFVRLLEAVKVRRGPERNLRGWLIGTAQHIVSDYFRGRYRHPIETMSEALPNDGLEPGEQAAQNLDVEALKLAVAQLTEEQQHVLTLRFGQGYSLEETAGLMKKNVNAIKALQFRALSALQRRIGGAE
jgi:RNA polymerase sigma-70 factor (ECF subfamily)